MTNFILRGHAGRAARREPTGSAVTTLSPMPRFRRGRGDHGQATAEYGLVLLGAAGIALLLVTWATKSGAIGNLFDTVMDKVIGKVK